MQNKTCIIVPCYNEAKRIEPEEFVQFCKNNSNIYFCLVNDGSTDETENILNDIVSKSDKSIFKVNLSINSGKAEAVRSGILEVLNHYKFDFVGYIDADLSVPLCEVKLLLAEIEKNNTYNMIFGSRVKRLGSNIKRNELRHYIGRIMSTIAGMILQLPVYDTQCGAKIFTAEYARVVFSQKFLSSWLFDVEIFERLVNNYGIEKINKSVLEVPLNTWIEKGNSKVKFSYVFKLPFELLKIYKIKNLNSKTVYKK